MTTTNRAPSLRTLDRFVAFAIRDRALEILRSPNVGILTMAEAIDRAWAERTENVVRS